MSVNASSFYQRTSFPCDKVKFTWLIENFSATKRTGVYKCMKSEVFKSGCTNSKWSLDFYPNGLNQNYANWIGLSLKLQQTVNQTVRVRFTFSFRDSGDRCAYQSEWIENEFSGASSEKQILQVIERQKLDSSFTDGILHLHLEIEEELEETCSFGIISEKAFSRDSSQSLVAEVCSMLEKKKFSDLIIAVGGTTIEVHRLIMAGASPVFAAMLEHNMVESSTKRVEIADFELSTVQEMVNFIYSRRRPGFESLELHRCLDILRASDKYALAELKSILVHYLLKALTSRNVADILLAADLSAADDLKETCLKFIRVNKIKSADIESFDVIEKSTGLWKDIAVMTIKELSE